MAKENADDNAQVAAGQQGDNAQVAAETGETPPATGTQDAKGPVPYDRFDEVNKAKNAAEQERDYLQQLVNLSQANQPTQAPAQPPQEQDPLGLSGIADDDLVSGQQLKDVVRKAQEESRQTQQEQDRKAETRAFLSQHPDYDELVGTANLTTGQFQFSEVMQRAIKEDPSLLATLQTNPDRRAIAYRTATATKRIIELEKKAAGITEQQAQKETETLISPMSPAAVGGGGTLAQAGRVGRMSDEEYAEEEKKVMGGEYDTD